MKLIRKAVIFLVALVMAVVGVTLTSCGERDKENETRNPPIENHNPGSPRDPGPGRRPPSHDPDPNRPLPSPNPDGTFG